MRYTVTEALAAMRRLERADTGRLRGIEVRYDIDRLTGLSALPAPWGPRLIELIEDRKAGRTTADTPQYLVCSDGLPIAWVTMHAAVVTPDVPLSRVQARHRRDVAQALATLDRSVLDDLADQCDQRDGRPTTGQDTLDPGMVRVARLDDPTRTRWVRISPDLDAARQAVGRAVGDTADHALVITAVGYGHHGEHAHRLPLPLLCAIQQVATAHQVSLRTVGDWIDDEHGLAGRVAAATLARQFGDAYLGRYASRGGYTEHRMREQGLDGPAARARHAAVLRPSPLRAAPLQRRGDRHRPGKLAGRSRRRGIPPPPCRHHLSGRMPGAATASTLPETEIQDDRH